MTEMVDENRRKPRAGEAPSRRAVIRGEAMAKKAQCIDPEEGIFMVDYEQDWMTPDDAQAFEQGHLARCAACREQLALFKPLWADLRAHPEIFDEAEQLIEEQAQTRRERWRR